MRWREFIAGLGSAAAWPLAVRAQQQPTMPVIGYLSFRSAQDAVPELALFRQGMGEAGYVEGKNVTIECRWGDGEYGRMLALAGEFVHRPVQPARFELVVNMKAAKALGLTIPETLLAIADEVIQ
jgi:putative tryptophan/tyrosine transport system substrate-binding protein